MTATIRKCPSKPDLQSCGTAADRGARSNHESGNDSVAKRCWQILEFYQAEAGKSEHDSARWLVEQLSQDEQEVAARCSYAYWYLSRLPQEQHASPIESARFASAMREAIRHENCADDREEVLKLLKTTLDFHKTHKSTLYRTCMFESEDGRCSDSIDDMFLSQQRRERIHEEMLNFQTHVVRGHDKEDRAIFFAFPRKAAGKPDQEQLFVDAILYTMERALACSEFRSIGRQDELFLRCRLQGGILPSGEDTPGRGIGYAKVLSGPPQASCSPQRALPHHGYVQDDQALFGSRYCPKVCLSFLQGKVCRKGLVSYL